MQNEDRRVDEMLHDARWPQDGDDDDDDAKMFVARALTASRFVVARTLVATLGDRVLQGRHCQRRDV